MAKSDKRSKCLYDFLRYSAVSLFWGGFIYQTLQFLFLYWTYPTVVDIQQSSPSYLEAPAFTFCNRAGYYVRNICDQFEKDACANNFFGLLIAEELCGQFSYLCINNTLPNDFKVVFFGKFMERNELKPEDIPKLAIPLEDYLTCTIEFAGKTENCNLENVMGSFYSLDELPHFCYTIYSLWGKPDKKRELIPKGATMEFHLYLNISQRPPNSGSEGDYDGPLFNPPSDASVQVAVHSPYFLPSPYLEGSSFMGGRAYELRIKLSERHLLPLPYQTNCTDYMTSWRLRGGKAPINQLSLIQECRMNKTYEALGCIPMNLDYPHNYTICKTCSKSDPVCTYVEPLNECTLLGDSYNQPCDSMVYEVEKENKVITIFKKPGTEWAHKSEGIRVTLTKHDCEGKKLWSAECSTVTISVPFDRYEITNITYYPKFESLELFSVIGGYMGMWLGISLLTVFDLFGDAFVKIRNFIAEKKEKQSLVNTSRITQRQNYANGRITLQPTNNNVW